MKGSSVSEMSACWPQVRVSRCMRTTDSGPPSARTTRMETCGREATLATAITIVPERSGEPQARQTEASRGFSVSQRGQYSIASMEG